MSEIKQGNQILLTREDAIIFMAFKQHQDKIVSLLGSGMCDMQSGKVEINIHNNQIQSVYLYQMAYRRKVDNVFK